MLTKCIWCENEPIVNSRNMLGKQCNYYLYRYGTPDKNIIWSPLRRKAIVIKNIINKYGCEFLNDIILLSWKPFWSLSDIAQKYGMTRERARQLKLFHAPKKLKKVFEGSRYGRNK